MPPYCNVFVCGSMVIDLDRLAKAWDTPMNAWPGEWYELPQQKKMNTKKSGGKKKC